MPNQFKSDESESAKEESLAVRNKVRRPTKVKEDYLQQIHAANVNYEAKQLKFYKEVQQFGRVIVNMQDFRNTSRATATNQAPVISLTHLNKARQKKEVGDLPRLEVLKRFT